MWRDSPERGAAWQDEPLRTPEPAPGACCPRHHYRHRVRTTDSAQDSLSAAPRPPRPPYIRRRSPTWLTVRRCSVLATTQPDPAQPTMAKLIVLLVACLALTSARLVRREAPSGWNELEKHATEFQKTITDQFGQLANSQNTQEFNKALKEGSDSVLKQLSLLSNSLQSALSDANGKAKEALEQTRASIQKTADELRRAHPEVEQQANQLKEKLQSAVQNAVVETQKLAKEVGANIEQTNQKLSPQLKQAYDDFVKQADAVQKKLHEAANKQ